MSRILGMIKMIVPKYHITEALIDDFQKAHSGPNPSRSERIIVADIGAVGACSLCDKDFLTLPGLFRHMKKYHNLPR